MAENQHNTKDKKPQVICFYTGEQDLREILKKSFLLFVRKELDENNE